MIDITLIYQNIINEISNLSNSNLDIKLVDISDIDSDLELNISNNNIMDCR